MLVALIISAIFFIQNNDDSIENTQINKRSITGLTEKIVKTTANNENILLTIKEKGSSRFLVLTDEMGEEVAKISENVFVYDAFWKADQNQIIYTAVKNNVVENTKQNVDIWISDLSGENNKLIKETTFLQVIAKFSPENSLVVYATPSSLYKINLETGLETKLLDFPEFGDNSDVLYVPEPFIQDNTVNMVLNKYENGEIVRESVSADLFN
ncbi:MAG: hypothetical protein Kow0081_2650 [Candidatus Dojkabacteria bacterium]